MSPANGASPPKYDDGRRLLLRRILPGAVVITIGTGWAGWYADERGLISHTTGVALMSGLAIVLIGALAFWAANRFDVLTSRERQVARDGLYRLLAGSYPDGGMFLFDRDLRYVLVEGRNFDDVGLVPEEFEGRLISEVLTADEVAMVEPVYRAALAGETTAVEMPYRNRDYAVSVGPTRDEAGEVVGGLVLTRDITQQKALRDQVYQLQKMDAVGQLASGIAHDFNNLLLAFRGYTEMAKRDPTNERVDHWLGEALKASAQASTLVKQLLSFSREESVSPEIVSLNALIEDTREMLERLIGAHIAIDCELDPDLGFIDADPGRINQVLVNLVVNARDAMQHGGTVKIRTTTAELDNRYASANLDARPGRYCRLSITDEGVGMDADTIARIFEPFYTTKERGHGTGLGLSTVYGIVKQSGGHIDLTSEPGRGTTFDVYLPLSVAVIDCHPETATSSRARSVA